MSLRVSSSSSGSSAQALCIHVDAGAARCDRCAAKLWKLDVFRAAGSFASAVEAAGGAAGFCGASTASVSSASGRCVDTKSRKDMALAADDRGHSPSTGFEWAA